MVTSQDPGSRGVEAAHRAADLRHRPEESVTQDDVEEAERSAEEARLGAAQAAHSAARSLEDTARLHERVAGVEENTVRQGASRADVHEESVAFHRNSADNDRKLAETKRTEATADEAPGTSR